MRRKGFVELVDWAVNCLGYSQAEAEVYATERLRHEPVEGQLEIGDQARQEHDPKTMPFPEGY